MNLVESLTNRCLLGIYWTMGLLPLPPVSELLLLLLSLLIRCIWLCYFLVNIWIGCGYLWMESKLSIGFATGTAVFIGNALLSLLIQVESMWKHHTHERLENLRFQLKLQMQRLGMSRSCRRSVHLLLLLGTQLACEIFKSLVNAHSQTSPVHYKSMAQMWLLRTRYIQLLGQLIELNQRTLQLRHSLLGLAAGNDIWQPYAVEDWKQLETLCMSYDRIYESYEAFNDCYGWGILGLQLTCGLEFVANAYWTITEVYAEQRIYMVVYNGTTCLAMGTLIIALFWYGDASDKNSRQIGCLIPKLVKPLGSKRYNDLVSEFLLQALHQRFVVNAKHFFSLNLQLLSSMFAAVLTYLVILIQFKFSEKSSQIADMPANTQIQEI
ncbi:GH11161 [Drosophila grimshawi]|uniref:Gustatory receptor n=1 Tax=Drosophila grimshawi TaxID=7222 RepID=B4JDC6_DROGR|nr:GH11161 [Drosophila grimshawi]